MAEGAELKSENWVMVVSEQHRYQGVSYKSDIIVISGNNHSLYHPELPIPTDSCEYILDDYERQIHGNHSGLNKSFFGIYVSMMRHSGKICYQQKWQKFQLMLLSSSAGPAQGGG